MGWLVEDPATPLVFVADDGQDRDVLVRACLGIGYEHLAGEVTGGVDAWARSSRETTSTPLLHRPIPDVAVLDVRQASEVADGHVPGAVHIELGALTDQIDKVPDGPVVAHCMHGQRSMTAASILERAGRDDVEVFIADPDEWSTEGTPA